MGTQNTEEQAILWGFCWDGGRSSVSKVCRTVVAMREQLLYRLRGQSFNFGFGFWNGQELGASFYDVT
eukprot:3941581-Amphidinium_carterae.1